MQSEERDLIEGLFGRLKAYEAQPRDPEADRLIASLVASQPGTPYLLTQTVLVQEHALKAAQARIAELEAKAAAAPPPSFLGSAPKIGPWGAAPSAAPASAPPPPQVAPPSAASWQASPQLQAGGGFLRSALTTAAGVAGGALLFDGIRSMFGGHSASPWSNPNNLAGDTSTSPLMPPDQLSPADLAQDDSQYRDNGQYNDQSDINQDDSSADSYDTASDSSGFDDSTDV